jgi:two-component system LytT family response regulator
MIRAIIVDDVAQARETLKADLKDYCPEIEIIGEAEGVVSGAKIIKAEKPEVVFLDIQMQDGSGFDLLEILPNVDFNIIFTTASDEFAIKAFKFSAIDYLLKPIDPDELMAAVKKLEETHPQSEESLELLKEHIGDKKPLKRLALNTLEKIHITSISDIVRLESNVNYTMFYFSDQTRLLVTKTLKEFDGMLSEHGFIRVHQSHLINVEYLKEYVKTDGGYLVMTDKSEVPVSTRKKNVVMEMIGKL